MTKQRGQQQEDASVEARWVSFDTVHVWVDNPRKHGNGVQKIARSIRRFGWGSPCLVRAENLELIAGHGRFYAAELLRDAWQNATEKARKRWHPDAVRVAQGFVLVRAMDLSEDKAHQLALADNRAAEESEWDKDLLTPLLEEWRDDEIDLSSLGFDSKELSKLLGEDRPRKNKDDDDQLEQSFVVIIECEDETQQVEILEEAHAKGWKCRALT